MSTSCTKRLLQFKKIGTYCACKIEVGRFGGSSISPLFTKVMSSNPRGLGIKLHLAVVLSPIWGRSCKRNGQNGNLDFCWTTTFWSDVLSQVPGRTVPWTFVLRRISDPLVAAHPKRKSHLHRDQCDQMVRLFVQYFTIRGIEHLPKTWNCAKVG